jgi:SAM-dependent methyltransferase
MIATLFRGEGEEIMDREGLSARGVRILRDLDRWNAVSGWTRGHVRRVRAHWEALGRPRPFRVLDVGTGPGALLEALAASDLPVELTGLDLQDDYVRYAQERLGGRARVVQGDATALPFGPGTFDLVTNTLTLHHIPRAQRPRIVEEIRRVARSAYLFDLEITLYGLVCFAPGAVAVGMGLDSVHDGIVSLRRSSTLDELAELVRPLPVRVVRVFPSAMCTMPG